MTNIAVTGEENFKESSVHFFFNLWLSVPIYCHNFTHRVCVRAGPLSGDCQSHKNPDNQSPDHELMRARACCLHSLSVLFPLSHPDSPYNLIWGWSQERERVGISYAVTGTWECLHCPLCAHQTVMDGWQRGNLFIDSLHQSGWGPGSWLWKNLLTSN